MSTRGVLAISGLLMFGGYGALWLIEPLSSRIPSFLFVYSYLFFILFGLVIWLKKRGEITHPNERESVVVIFVFGILFRLIMIGLEPTLSDDVYRYIWDGQVQKAGINPYLFPPSSPELEFLKGGYHDRINHPTVRTIYPPLSQYVYRAGVIFEPSVMMQKVNFFIFDLLFLFLLIKFLRLMSRSTRWALLYAWNPLCVIEFAGSGHNDSLMLCLMMSGFLLYQKKKEAAGMVAFAGAALSKFIPVVMLPWLLLHRSRRFLVLYFLTILFLCFPFLSDLVKLASPTHSVFSGLHSYTEDWVFNPSIYGWLSVLLPDVSLRKTILGLLLIGFSFLWAQKNRSHPFLYGFGVIFALLLCSPVVHPWYVIWLVPFLAVYPLWSGILWGWLVGFTYLVFIRYKAEGIWMLSPAVMLFEYGVLYIVLAFEIVRGFKQTGVGSVTSWGNKKPEKIDNKLIASVIIPVLNEEASLPTVLNEIPKEFVHEIVVVDNGSTDGTAEAARKAGAKVISEPVQGYGRAVQAGLREINPECDTVVILDGDHSDYPEDLPKLLAPLSRGEADMVIGTRSEAALPGSLMPQQRFGNWLTCLLIRILYGERFTDVGPFRAIRTSALQDLKMEDPNFGWNVEMQVKALQKGLRIVEAPVRYRPRIGKSKISGTFKGSLKAGVIILYSLYKYGWAAGERTANGSVCR